MCGDLIEPIPVRVGLGNRVLPVRCEYSLQPKADNDIIMDGQRPTMCLSVSST
jgi:hypothetical protein